MTYLQLPTFMGKEGCGEFFGNFDIMFWNLSKTNHPVTRKGKCMLIPLRDVFHQKRMLSF
jgi:hypothetical protein